MTDMEKLSWMCSAIPKALLNEIIECKPDRQGFVYSEDGKRLLMAADAETYYIPEGVEVIEPSALFGCTINVLHIPYTCLSKLDEYPQANTPSWNCESNIGDIRFWDLPYAEVDNSPNSLLGDDNNVIFDKHKVAYSRNGKRLLFARMDFLAEEYIVRDGTKTICSYAFNSIDNRNGCLRLRIPQSVCIIGHDIFGPSGGFIQIKR